MRKDVEAVSLVKECILRKEDKRETKKEIGEI